VQRNGTGRRRRDEIDRGDAVMAERKANLTIVDRHARRRMAGWGPDTRNGKGTPRRERERVMVPREERRLQEDRKDGEKRGATTRGRRPRLARPIS